MALPKDKKVSEYNQVELNEYCQLLFDRTGKPATRGVCKRWKPGATGYAFARESEFSNVGEDLANSRRHKANKYINLKEAEADGEGRLFANRDKLLESLNINFLDGITEENAESKFAYYLLLKRFMPQPDYNSKFKSLYKEDKLREEYISYFDFLVAQRDLFDSKSPEDALTDLQKLLKDKIEEATDAENKFFGSTPVGTQFSDYNWNIVRSQFKKNSIRHALHELENESPSKKLERIKTIIESGKLSDKDIDRKKGDVVGSVYETVNSRIGKEIPLKTYEEQTEFLTGKTKIRGLQWGQYITDKERPTHAKALCEAMTDLSEALGVPVEKLSFGGKLGISIGARGSGNASAHYEPSSKVINITREGSGAFAHEYVHFLDNLIAEKLNARVAEKNRATKGGQFITNSWISPRNASPELDELNNRVRVFQNSLESFRSRMGKNLNSMQIGRSKFDYYVNNNQELFARVGERIIQKKLEAKGMKNTYLSGSIGDNVYPTDEELKTIEPAFDRLMESIKKNWD